MKHMYWFGAWPSQVGEIQLEYKGDDNQVQTADITFKYQYCYKRSANDPLQSTGR